MLNRSDCGAVGIQSPRFLFAQLRTVRREYPRGSPTRARQRQAAMVKYRLLSPKWTVLPAWLLLVRSALIL